MMMVLHVYIQDGTIDAHCNTLLNQPATNCSDMLLHADVVTMMLAHTTKVYTPRSEVHRFVPPTTSSDYNDLHEHRSGAMHDVPEHQVPNVAMHEGTYGAVHEGGPAWKWCYPRRDQKL